MKTNISENFLAISEFLDAFAPEVSGRSTDAVTPDLEKRIASMASGDLNEEESRQLSRELLANENALSALANHLSQDV